MSTVGRNWFRPVELRRVGPETFQTVILSLLLLEQVNDDVAKVEQDPFPLRSTLAAQWLQVEVFTEPVLDRFGQCLHMRTRCPRCDDKDVRENKLLFDIEERDVEPFLGLDGVGGPVSKISTAL